MCRCTEDRCLCRFFGRRAGCSEAAGDEPLEDLVPVVAGEASELDMAAANDVDLEPARAFFVWEEGGLEVCLEGLVRRVRRAESIATRED